MGWIYGNVVVGENALSNGSASSYQYDKIFSNYYLAQLTEQSDGVFLGRKILIDYDQDLKETLIRVQHTTIQVEQKDDDGNIMHDGAGNPVYENVTGYFYWNSDSEYNYTIKDLVSLSSIDKNTIVYEEQSDETRFLICDSLLTLDQETSPATLLSVTDIESKNNEEDEIKQSLKKIQEIYNNSNYKTNYEKNAKIDKELLENSALADSTIWQKVSVNNTLKYIKIAELNAKNPKIELLIKPPNPNGICSIPYINADNEDNYKLVMSAQPGFRINPHPYFPVEPYRKGVYTYIEGNKHTTENSDQYDPTKQYYRDEQAVEIYCYYTPKKFYLNNNLNGQPFNLDESEYGSTNSSTQYYIYGSDEGAYYTDYNNVNGELKNPEYKPKVAIYYNKDGLSKEKHFHVDVKNSIQFLQDGYSNYPYDTGEIYYELANINKENFSKANKTNLYYSLNDDGRYCEVDNDHKFNSSATYYYKRTINSQPDVNQLSICLPSIGNMVCEGWDKIYGEARVTGEVDYDPVNNKIGEQLINGNIENTDPNSIIGLLNALKRKTQELRGFSDDSIASKVAAIANSLNLKITTDQNNLETYEYLGKTSKPHIIQNQIANSNLAIESLVNKIGLQSLSDDCYVEVPNVTKESFVPNLYYIKNGNSYTFASEYDDDTTYYTCRAKNIELNKSNTSTSNTIQGQIDENFAAAGYRINDIQNLAAKIGLNCSKNPTLTQSGVYADITPIQTQINSNDTDISNLVSLLGVSRGTDGIPTQCTIGRVDSQGNAITQSISKHLTDLQNDSYTHLDYLKEIATRLRNIEAFLADGHFLFTAGRSAEQASFSSPSDNLPR